MKFSGEYPQTVGFASSCLRFSDVRTCWGCSTYTSILRRNL